MAAGNAPTALEAALSGFPRRVPLTPHEVAVMEFVAQGYSNARIAAELGNMEATITRHIMAVRVKLRARHTSREELIAAYRASCSPCGEHPTDEGSKPE